MPIKVISQGYRNAFKITMKLLKLFYTNSFVFVSFNVDVEHAMHRDLVTQNNFINYDLQPNFNFHFIDFESSYFLEIGMIIK